MRTLPVALEVHWGHSRTEAVDRLLSAMGWQVVSVPFFEWASCIGRSRWAHARGGGSLKLGCGYLIGFKVFGMRPGRDKGGTVGAGPPVLKTQGRARPSGLAPS